MNPKELTSYFKRMSALAFILLDCLSAYPLEIEIDSLGTDIQPTIHELNEVTIDGMGSKSDHKIGNINLSGAEINKTPAIFGEKDALKALQSSAGVVAGTEGFAGLYVRGGENDQNLYLIDGLPLLNVYHFGGLFSTFSTNSINNLNFYKGAFPSQFSERASGIVDIALKKPDLYKTSGVFSLGLISGNLYLTTPIKKGYAAASFSLRRTWFDIFSMPVLAIINKSNESDGKKTIFNYNFSDLILKVDATDRKRNDFSLVMFYGKDNMKNGTQLFDTKNDNRLTSRDLNKLGWGNWGVALNYNLTTAVGNLRIQPSVTKSFALDHQENSFSNEGGEIVSMTSETRPSVLQVGMKETFRTKFSNFLEGEIGLQQSWYEYKVKEKYSSVLLSGFADLSWNVGRIFQGNVGIRINRYLSNSLNHWNFEPRLSMKFNLPRNSSISLGYSHITQYAQQISSNYIYLPSDAWMPTASYSKPLTSDILSIGYSKTFARLFTFKAEAWWKNMENLAEFKSTSTAESSALPWNQKITFGKGWAYGIDLELNGYFNSISWQVGYGLMWNWRKFKDLNRGMRYPAKFDNRNKIDIQIGWKISNRLELTGQWEYMTGNRITLALYNIAPPNQSFPDAPFVNPIDPGGGRNDGIDFFENRNNVRMPSFHRLNLNLSLTGNIKKKLIYQWDFGLYNAYCRMNPFSLTKSYVNENWTSNNGDYRKFKTLSLLPILPSVSFTLNF
ncbi:MAG: TonB-dependent receptor plug domain-containing protein [Muribaculaceae bacterium]|nr:TonB-dependent receptor plug domain-containing protein [Muribaculaceae bacterium]